MVGVDIVAGLRLPISEDVGTSQEEENWVSRGLGLQQARSARNTLGSPA